MIVGVDVGYGYTKAWVLDGRAASFPSAVREAAGSGALADALGAAELPHRVRFTLSGAQRQMLVGDAALFAGAARTWDAAAADRADYGDLTLAALAVLGVYGDVEVGAGLPLERYRIKEERRALRTRLQGLEACVAADRGSYACLRISRLRLFPQGAGAYIAAVAEEPALARRSCAVLDVGFRTTDFLVMRTPRGGGPAVPDEAASGTLDLGMHRVYAGAARAVGRAEGAVVDAERVEDAALSGASLTVAGRGVDLAGPLAAASEELSSELAARLRRAWGRALDDAGAVLLAGGGASALHPWLSKALPGVRLVREGQGANARGYALALAAAPVEV